MHAGMTNPIQVRQVNTPLFFTITGHLFFLVLFIYSIVYAVERSTYVDSAWQMFQRINDEGFCFPSERYGVFFSELPLLLAVKLHLPLKYLIYIFSSSYILLYYFIWWICVYRLKNLGAGIAIILCLIMGVREGFVHPVTETQQCVIYSVLLLALLQYKFRSRYIHLGFVALLSLVISFTHPVGLFTAGFACLYHVIRFNNIRLPEVWLAISIVAGLALWRFISPVDPYDTAIYGQLKSTNDQSFNLFQSGAIQFLLLHSKHFYWLPELAALVTFIWLAINKQWKMLIVLIVSFSGFLIIAGVTFRNGDSSILMERAFLPAFFMVNLVIGMLMAHESALFKYMPQIMLIAFLIFGIRFINAGCLMYKKRTQYLDVLVQQAIAQGKDKYILAQQDADLEKILVPWALGTETLIYSTIRYDKSVSITLEPEGCATGFVRLTTSMCLPLNELNPNFFKLSAAPYTQLVIPAKPQ
jgi:hypothetical protein